MKLIGPDPARCILMWEKKARGTIKELKK